MRTVTDPSELASLPLYTVVLDRENDVWQRRLWALKEPYWALAGSDDIDDTYIRNYGPWTVLWEPPATNATDASVRPSVNRP